jgi:hypothetical protein
MATQPLQAVFVVFFLIAGRSGPDGLRRYGFAQELVPPLLRYSCRRGNACPFSTLAYSK